jgi:hypothetical protein
MTQFMRGAPGSGKVDSEFLDLTMFPHDIGLEGQICFLLIGLIIDS